MSIRRRTRRFLQAHRYRRMNNSRLYTVVVAISLAAVAVATMTLVLFALA